MNNITIISSRKPMFKTLPCTHCSSQIEFSIPNENSSTYNLRIKCYNCGEALIYDNVVSKASSPSSPSRATTPQNGAAGGGGGIGSAGIKKKYKMGTDDEPYSLEYYEILNLTPKASAAEIKKKYYALAMQYHPDKNSTPEAEGKFKKISEAYQVLSDPVLRKKYNEFGPKGSAPEGGFMNPEDFFQAQFGGDRFIDIIGELAIAKHFKSAMVDAEEAEDAAAVAAGENGASIANGASDEAGKDLANVMKNKSLEKRIEEMELRKKEREIRVTKLAENLVIKLAPYGKGMNEISFRKFIEDETEELKVQNYGVQLLQSIGYIYGNKSNEYLTKDEFLGITSFMHKMKMKGHAINETFTTVKSAVDVHRTFVQLQESEKRGDVLTQEQKDRLESEAARKGVEALWQGCKLEIESVLRSVCDRVLGAQNVDKMERKRRAEALKIVSDVYRAVKLDYRD